MYLRLTSTVVPTMFLGRGEYVVSEDKSCIVMRGAKEGHYLETPPLTVRQDSIHVALRPELGATTPQILTADDGTQTLRFRVSLAAEELAQMDYHFKVYFQPVTFFNR